jgi:hypothetical protein
MLTVSEALEKLCQTLDTQFNRSIVVSEDFTEIITRTETILVPAREIKDADLLELGEDLVHLAQSFDKRVQEERARYIQNLETNIVNSFEKLHFRNPERAQELITSLLNSHNG